MSGKNISTEDLKEILSRINDPSPVGIAVINYDGSYVSVNPAYCNIYGYEQSELLGHSFTMVFKPQDQSWVLTLHKKFLDEGGTLSGEWDVVKRDGSIIYIISKSVTIPTGAGKPNRLVYVIDITERKKLEQQAKHFESIVKSSEDAIISKTLEGIVISWNPGAENLFGYSAQEMIGRPMLVVFPPDRVHEEEQILEKIRRGEAVEHYETSRIRKDGATIEVSVTVSPIRDDTGKVIGASKVARDITHRKQMEADLLLASMVLQNSSEGMLVTDANNCIIAVNPAFTAITGYSFDEVQGRDPKILNSGRQDKAFYDDLWHSLHTTGHWRGEIWDKRKDGQIHAKLLTINKIVNNQGEVHRYVALFSDITEQKKSEELIWQQANFDILTGLPNRRMFRDRLEHAILQAKRSSLTLAVLLIDLDNFKEVNDSLGHDIGDILLKDAALRIAACLRSTDTVARLGGDEFVVILTEISDANKVDQIAESMVNLLSEPFQLGGEISYISTSIGISLLSNDNCDAETLLKSSDQAMYLSKNQGRNRYSYYTPALQEASLKRLKLTHELHDALTNNQFIVHYQPIVELATGNIYKAEALIRWNHPERGIVGPADFIQLAEQTGLIVEMGLWVFKQALLQVDQWKKRFNPLFQISVNRSPVQFRSVPGKNLIPCFDYMEETNIPGHGIIFEITEGLLLDSQSEVSYTLLKFRDAGIQVALDDFGTGYSSLSYLKKFDIDYLKIDKSFVDQLESDPNDVVLCEAIIVMAHKLGIKVIAEGIETEAQSKILLEAGCDFGQGYLFSKPVPADVFEALLLK